MVRPVRYSGMPISIKHFRGNANLSSEEVEGLAQLLAAVQLLAEALPLTDGVPKLPTFIVAELPDPTTNAGGFAFASDETGGPTMVVSDGTNWRRMQDYVIAS